MALIPVKVPPTHCSSTLLATLSSDPHRRGAKCAGFLAEPPGEPLAALIAATIITMMIIMTMTATTIGKAIKMDNETMITAIIEEVDS